jgi:hypothetical protein
MQHDHEKLEAFFEEVANLTVNHNVLLGFEDEYAVVYPSKLGKALEKVDPEWFSTNKN